MRSYSPRLLLALFVALAGRPAAAQSYEAPGARPSWTPPFAPASPALLGGLQNLLATPAGLKLISDIPSFSAVRSLSPASDTDLRVVGALSAQLPADFDASLAAALRRAQKDPATLAELTKTLGGAYQAAVPEVAKSVRSRARQVVVSVAYDKIGGRALVEASDQLERFDFYGPVVQDQSRIVKRLASQDIMERAQRIAANFLGARSQESGFTYAPRGEKKTPEDWKLHASAKPADKTASAGRAPPPPPPAEPKAKPKSADLYERIGAARGMTAAQIEAAYRRTAELYRPERYIDRDTKSIIIVTMSFKRVEEAYATLGDPKKRAEYDGGKLARPPAANPLSDDFYERIGAGKGMSQAEIKAAYRRAAAAYHPDKSRTKEEALVKAMTKAFQDIGEAYATLEDPQKRAAYDRKLADRSSR